MALWYRQAMGQAASYEKGQAALPSCLPDPCRCEGEELAMRVFIPAQTAQASAHPSTQAGPPHRASAVHAPTSRDPGAHSQKVPTSRMHANNAHARHPAYAFVRAPAYTGVRMDA